MATLLKETRNSELISFIYDTSKLFYLAVHERRFLIDPVFLQEETGLPQENLRCLVESN